MSASSEEGPRPHAHVFLDAGHTGCGELVLDLRFRLLAMGAREVLHVRALDPGAPEDLPAWCRMTGHSLIAMEHPDYWIQRRN